MREAFEKILALQNQSAKTQTDVAGLQQKLHEITADQARLRANLKEMPETAAAYKRYLKKFDDQETMIEKLQDQIQELQKQAIQQRQELDAFVDGLYMEATIEKASPLP
jgi:septal ring factor EnvC (AmiA/AmiB activator)